MPDPVDDRQALQSKPGLAAQITSGFATDWSKSSIRWQGNYTSDWAERGTVPLTKQFVGDFVTSTGFQVHLRDMGTYNGTLLEQVLSDFYPLQSEDVLLVRRLLLPH